ncbi:MAG: signal recognition particle-docking protein FtsY [Chloroflexi bacterium]|nr:signal recognition particle-docking protein FtsY [Chloroflexota bacterium]
MGLFTATVSAIRRSLTRTREALGTPLGDLLGGRSLSDAVVDEIETLLLTADAGPKATTLIIQELREARRAGRIDSGSDALEFLANELKTRLACPDRDLVFADSGPSVMLIAGINGSGKTTSVAKIAKSLHTGGRSVLLAAADTFRAGAVAQLEIWARRLDLDIIKGAKGADPAAVAFDAADAALSRGVDVLLIDTAGRLHTQVNLMRQLTKIRDVLAKKIPDAPHEVLLVLDATAGQNAIAQAQLFKQAIDVTGIFLAKLDGTAKGGIVIAIHDALGIPVKLVGLGETPDDVEVFDPDTFVDAMLGIS